MSLIPATIEYLQTPLPRRHYIQRFDTDPLFLLQHPHRTLRHLLNLQRLITLHELIVSSIIIPNPLPMKVRRHHPGPQRKHPHICPRQFHPQCVRESLLRSLRRMINALARKRRQLKARHGRNVQDRSAGDFQHAPRIQYSVRHVEIAG